MMGRDEFRERFGGDGTVRGRVGGQGEGRLWGGDGYLPPGGAPPGARFDPVGPGVSSLCPFTSRFSLLALALAPPVHLSRANFPLPSLPSIQNGPPQPGGVGIGGFGGGAGIGTFPGARGGGGSGGRGGPFGSGDPDWDGEVSLPFVLTAPLPLADLLLPFPSRRASYFSTATTWLERKRLRCDVWMILYAFRILQYATACAHLATARDKLDFFQQPLEASTRPS